MGLAAVLLMSAVCLARAAAAVGLWHGQRWGRWLAIGLLFANLLGDVVNTALGVEPWAAIGIPVVLALLIFLFSQRVRRFFAYALPAMPLGPSLERFPNDQH